MIVRTALLGLCLGSVMFTPALAKVSAEQAAQLGGPVLTTFGAQKAGNADGSIPPYTGGLGSIPPGITMAPKTFPPDPFASDKALFSINSANVDKYAASLTPGTVALMRKDPTYRIDVYPSRRTAYYPQWVLDNTRKNATTSELVGPVQGDGVANAYGGIPFPIPQNGNELLWNNELKWQGQAWTEYSWEFFVDSSGHRTLNNATEGDEAFLFYDRSKTAMDDIFFQKDIQRTFAPAAADGALDLIEYPINYGTSDSTIYTYTVGQRRVRLAPEFKYDTPVAQAGGMFTYDEIDLWQGRSDRFDFKIAGKKEMYVPYNCYGINQPATTEDKLFTPKHMNPDYIRWEKHRVWVLDSTLKPGKRHIYSRRTFYLDEDTWAILASEAYDQAGHLYRIGYTLSYPLYYAQDPFTFAISFLFYNLNTTGYSFTGYMGGETHGHVDTSSTLPSRSYFNPESLAGSGIR
ncbi:MAG: DUF1329 domain-containing protein [Janthinobacterium lividum]